MLSTGDVQGGLRKLETLLRMIKYPESVNYSGLFKGETLAFLPIVNFTLTSFSPPFAEQLIADGLELNGKTDLRFTDTLYKVLRDVFHYKPILTKQQFLQLGFSQRKISLICDIINLVLQKHNQLERAKVRCRALPKDSRTSVQPIWTDAFVSKSLDVVSYIKNPSSSSTNLSHTKALMSHDLTGIHKEEPNSLTLPEKVTMKLEGGVKDNHDVSNLSEEKGRISALEIKLESVLAVISRISILEKRVEELEKSQNTKEKEDVIAMQGELGNSDEQSSVIETTIK